MPDNFTPSRYISVIQGFEIHDIDLSFIKDEELRESIKNDFEECKSSLISEGYNSIQGSSFYGEPFIRDGETEIVEIPVNREHLNMKYFIPADDVFISTNSKTNKMLHTETPGAPAPNVAC